MEEPAIHLAFFGECGHEIGRTAMQGVRREIGTLKCGLLEMKRRAGGRAYLRLPTPNIIFADEISVEAHLNFLTRVECDRLRPKNRFRRPALLQTTRKFRELSPLGQP